MPKVVQIDGARASWLTLLCAAWLALLPAYASAERFVVEPYLQHATPTSMRVHWETDAAGPGSVEWGRTRQLGQHATSRSEASARGRRLHVAELRGLAPDTRYFYRVRTGALTSVVFDLRTPPAPSAEASISMLVLSDTQFDRKQPQVLAELAREGLAPWASESARARGDAPVLALIVGDLVAHGQRYDEWSEELFRPLSALARHVPLYAVAGNHDEDSPHYFRYFALPANGSASHPERWWWSDFSNVRVIGLDSNPPYRSAEQLAWLAGTLRDACYAQHLDFVFVALHHPEHSELWPQGEQPYSGLVSRQLERFASACGKPSVIFSGHTHAYARGHSRDHPLSFVQVASAGGDLDRRGEYPGRDYPEYVNSQDEYGFVVVDVQAGSEPQFRLRRISRGQPGHWRDNELRDQLVVRRHEQPPERPSAIWPREKPVDPEGVVLTSSAYRHPAGVAQGASHWQLGDGSCDFSHLLLDRWVQLERASAAKPGNVLRLPPLRAGSSYCYRVRMRDSSLAWSEWSEPQRFRTLAPALARAADAVNPSGL